MQLLMCLESEKGKGHTILECSTARQSSYIVSFAKSSAAAMKLVDSTVFAAHCRILARVSALNGLQTPL
jgi:hypothetical protein